MSRELSFLFTGDVMEEGLLFKAFILMLIGMGTVFLILTLVVVTANSLVRIINRYFPAAEKVVAKAPVNQISEDKVAVLNAAIAELTSGRGKIRSIKKLN